MMPGRDLWLCVDCTVLACNGDASGMSSETEARCSEGLAALGPNLSPNWDTDENTGEITEGHYDFSSIGCSCCGSSLAGEIHRFTLLVKPNITANVYESVGVEPGSTLPQYTSIGCYTILYLTQRGECLCAKCASENTDNDPVHLADVFWEGEPETCANCGREIESSYGPISECDVS